MAQKMYDLAIFDIPVHPTLNIAFNCSGQNVKLLLIIWEH